MRPSTHKRYADRHIQVQEPIKQIIPKMDHSHEGRIEVTYEDDSFFYFSIKAKNGRLIIKSIGYSKKDKCFDGIANLRKTIHAKVIDKTIKEE